jgi:hypothetical protein
MTEASSSWARLTMLIDCLSKGVLTLLTFPDGLRLSLPSKVKVLPFYSFEFYYFGFCLKSCLFGMVEV